MSKEGFRGRISQRIVLNETTRMGTSLKAESKSLISARASRNRATVSSMNTDRLNHQCVSRLKMSRGRTALTRRLPIG